MAENVNEDPAKVEPTAVVEVAAEVNGELPCVETNEEAASEPQKGERKHKYGAWDVICVLISLFTYTFDQVTDLVVAVYYYHRGLYWYFGLTLGFVILPSLTMTTFSLTWYIQDYRDGLRPPGSRLQWAFRAICLFLNCGPILRYFESLCYGCQLNRKSAKKKETYFYIMIYEDTDASLLRLFECFMESAPQLVLQIYILAKNEIPENVENPVKRKANGLLIRFAVVALLCYLCGYTVFIETNNRHFAVGLQVASITTSLVSLSWAIASYNRSLRFSLDDKMKLNWFATIFQFVWRFFNITSRVLSLALFASVFPLYIFIVCLIHWVIMTIWIFIQKTQFCKRRWEEVFFDMVMGVVFIFCFLNVKEEPTRYKTTAYHVFILLEGSTLMITWYLVCDPTVWYHLPALLGFYSLFFVGILLMIVYYLYSHPSISYRTQVSVNGDMPDHVLPSVLMKKEFVCGPVKKLSRRPRMEVSFEETVKL